jgi:hypothetical protein
MVLAPGFRRLKAERLDPEWLTAVAETWELFSNSYVVTRSRPYPSKGN